MKWKRLTSVRVLVHFYYPSQFLTLSLRLPITQILWARIPEQKEKQEEEKASEETKENLGKMNENPMQMKRWKTRTKQNISLHSFSSR